MSVLLSRSDLGAVQQGTGAHDRRVHADNPLDALIVGYYEGDKLMFASKVRNGFVPRLCREVWAKLKLLRTDACPFTNLPERKRTQWAPTREQMRDCVWLRPELVAQVEFTEWTPDS